MKFGIRAAVYVAVLVLPAAAMAQRTGVSHPEEVPVTTSPEGIAQPVVWENPAAPPATAVVATAAPELKTRTERAADVPPSNLAATAPTAPRVETYAQPVRADRDDRHALAAPAARPDVDGEIVMRIPGPANELPSGTLVKVRLREQLSTKLTTAGTVFTADLLAPVERDGRVLLPAGSVLNGRVTDVHGGRRISGAASLHLEPSAVTLPDGTRYSLKAQVIDTGLYRKEKVDGEGTIVRRGNAKATAAVMALSAGSGAAAGAVFGGWPGAIIGAGVGAGVSTVMWLKQDRQTELPSGTELTFGLTRPLAVGTEIAATGTE